MKKFVLALAMLASAGLAQAQGANNIYFGGGLSSNELSGWDRAIGYQFFGGMELPNVKLGMLKSAVEVGYMNSGEFKESVCVTFFGQTQCVSATAEATGLWANYVVSYPFTPALSGIGRAGLDFGDDDGFMFGLGLGFKAAPKVEIRGEYVVRENIDSLQANVVFRL